MSRVYKFNPRRFERLLTVLSMNHCVHPTSKGDLESLYQFLDHYDSNRILKNYPSNVKHRILVRAFENICRIRHESESLTHLLSQSIKNRPFEQMDQIDRNLLILGAFELHHNQTAPRIIIKEILIVSDLLDNQKAGSYLSGILKTLAFGERTFAPFRSSIKSRPKIKLKRTRPSVL